MCAYRRFVAELRVNQASVSLDEDDCQEIVTKYVCVRVCVNNSGNN